MDVIEVKSNDWLADELILLINETVKMRKETLIGTPEWDTLEGRRAGLQTALNLITANVCDESRNTKLN